jgi:hypothetical protein
LDEAEGCLQRSASEARPSWLYWYQPAALLGYRGECYLDLQRNDSSSGPGLDETVAVLRGAMAHAGGWCPRDLARDRLNLADAYWVHGECEAAARYASDALMIAAGMDWRHVRKRLQDFQRRMDGVPLPAARDFVERFRTLVRG